MYSVLKYFNTARTNVPNYTVLLSLLFMVYFVHIWLQRFDYDICLEFLNTFLKYIIYLSFLLLFKHGCSPFNILIFKEIPFGCLVSTWLINIRSNEVLLNFFQNAFIHNPLSKEWKKLWNSVSIVLVVATGHYSHIFEHLEWEDWTRTRMWTD